VIGEWRPLLEEIRRDHGDVVFRRANDDGDVFKVSCLHGVSSDQGKACSVKIFAGGLASSHAPGITSDLHIRGNGVRLPRQPSVLQNEPLEQSRPDESHLAGNLRQEVLVEIKTPVRYCAYPEVPVAGGAV